MHWWLTKNWYLHRLWRSHGIISLQCYGNLFPIKWHFGCVMFFFPLSYSICWEPTSGLLWIHLLRKMILNLFLLLHKNNDHHLWLYWWWWQSISQEGLLEENSQLDFAPFGVGYLPEIRLDYCMFSEICLGYNF